MRPFVVYLGSCSRSGGLHVRARPFGFDLRAWFRPVAQSVRQDRAFLSGIHPALAAREDPDSRRLRARSAHAFLVVCVALAISATYELVEWWAALAMGQGRRVPQHAGDPWDTQSDMFMALIGAITAQLLLSRWHDRPGALAGRGKSL